MGDDILRMSTEEIVSRTRLLDNDVKVIMMTSSGFHISSNLSLSQVMKSETARISHEQQSMKDKIKVINKLIKFMKSFEILIMQENTEKIKVFKVLPYLVSNVVEV